MKRHIFVPLQPPLDRWVSVEDGTVRDLDGTHLGNVGRVGGKWLYRIGAMRSPAGEGYPTQATAIAALLADPSCPTPGPNRYDR